MDKFLKDNNYGNIFFILTVATSPFMTIGLIYETTLTRVAYVLSGVFSLGLIICVCLINRLPLAPKWIFKDLQTLFFPYAIALSAAIYSIDEGTAYVGYWFALGVAICMIAANHIPLRKF